MKTKLYLLTLILSALSFVIAKAQSGSSCANSISITPDTAGTPQSLQCSDSMMWFSFVADSISTRIEVANSSDTSYGFIRAIELYEGSCSNLILIQEYNSGNSREVDLFLQQGNLQAGNNYFVKVKKNISTCSPCNLDISLFDLAIKDLTAPVAPWGIFKITMDGGYCQPTSPMVCGLTLNNSLPDPCISSATGSEYCTPFTNVCVNTPFTMTPGHEFSFSPSFDNDHYLEWYNAQVIGDPNCFPTPVPQLTWDPMVYSIPVPGTYNIGLAYVVNCPTGPHRFLWLVFQVIVIDPNISLTITPSNPICSGHICFALSGNYCNPPSSPPLYEIDNGLYSTDPSGCIDDLPTGPHTITVNNILTQYCQVSLTQNFTVQLPSTEFSFNIQNCFDVAFTDVSVCAVSWLWDFGDGSPPDNSQNPNHTYSTYGTYTVTLTTYGTDNISSSITHQVAIIQPAPAITGNSFLCYFPNALQTEIYCTQQNNQQSAYSWSINPSTGSNILQQYDNCIQVEWNMNNVASPPSTITLEVTETSDIGCVGSNTFEINVADPPFADAGQGSTICIGDQVTLGQGQPNISGLTYSWSSSPAGFTSSQRNPAASPTTTTTYYLVVTDNGTGCTAMSSVVITVYPSVLPVISGFQNNCQSTSIVYSVPSDVTYQTYSWSILPSTAGNITSGQGTNQIAINWNAFSGAVSICLDIYDSYGCTLNVCLPVYECCNCGNDVVIDNINVNDLFTAYPSPIVTFDNIDTYTFHAFNLQTQINGVFTINENLIIEDGKDICLGPNAQIKILSGKKLKLDAVNDINRLKAGCNVMWDGIYIEHDDAELIITGVSTFTTVAQIQDAKNAIVSDDGGKYVIERTELSQNNKDIIVNPYPNVYLGTIISSNLGTVSTPLLDYYIGVNTNPQAGLVRTNTGIEINNATSLQIGDANNSNSLNKFENMDIGINNTETSLLVTNNKFKDITRITNCDPQCRNCTPCPVEGIAIWTKGLGYTTLSQPVITIGGTLTDDNVFDNCTHGVLAEKIQSLSVQKNYFHDVTHGIIAFGNHLQPSIDLSNNNFDHFTVGINAVNNTNCIMNIASNRFNENSALVGGTAIRVQNPVQTLWNLSVANVSSNIIYRVYTGIQLTNMSFSHVDQMNNIFFDNALPSFASWGIRNQNGLKNNIQDNVVLRCTQNTCSPTVGDPDTYPNSLFTKRLFGISEESGNFNIVYNNTVRYLGTGIRCFNTYAQNTFGCNSMYYNMHGFELINADPGTQGTSGQPSDNTWVWGGSFNPAADVFGNYPNSSSNQIWWSRSLNYPYATLGNIFPSSPSQVDFTQVTTSSQWYCTVINRCETQECNQGDLANSVMESRNEANSMTGAARYLTQRNVFETLRNDSTLMNVGTTLDSYLQAFYDSAENTSLGELAEVKFLLGQNEDTKAENKNSKVNPKNMFEINEKMVNEIYLSTWGREQFLLESEQINSLTYIASQNPISGGPAVYTARVMLGIDANDFGPEEEYRLSNSNKEKDRMMSVYPNPTSGESMFNCELFKDEKGMLEIYDVLCNKLMDYKLTEGKNEIEVNTNWLSSGVYFFKVIINGEFIAVNRLIVAK